MKQYRVRLTEAEDKAVLTDVLSSQEWIDNIAHNKARRCMDTICDQALTDTTHTILTVEEKQLVLLELNDRGIYLTTHKQLPADIKEQIVMAARVKSAAEINAEFEAISP